jgi:hypothetical protein
MTLVFSALDWYTFASQEVHQNDKEPEKDEQ